MSLVWPDETGKLLELKLELCHTYRIGRSPKTGELVIMDETTETIYKMGKSSSYVSRISPREDKYGSVVIRRNYDGSIEVARARNSINEIAITTSQTRRKITLPDENKGMVNLNTMGEKAFAICISSKDTKNPDVLISYLYTE